MVCTSKVFKLGEAEDPERVQEVRERVAQDGRGLPAVAEGLGLGHDVVVLRRPRDSLRLAPLQQGEHVEVDLPEDAGVGNGVCKALVLLVVVQRVHKSDALVVLVDDRNAPWRLGLLLVEDPAHVLDHRSAKVENLGHAGEADPAAASWFHLEDDTRKLLHTLAISSQAPYSTSR
eukprot:CAMPEP_0196644004 /NCGR_PEP_ID=MMETSP1085-20130531/6583_1 /TAXON_ID=41879 ORGANISM="Pycnococcus sp, Strain CCMP1998" /NCGR_SAMPLE_ID=MMETSP1085 /ASSEMBLY_ACC=CAM_ASM_000807 /LENGTH=174 /DNA_ID=CAMNT_0041973527 /DNA_START=333 /DNA_END=854 /DNA_ORIENTATION=-